MKDIAIEKIRETRKKISKRFDDDPKKLVAYYKELQKKYPNRLTFKSGT